MAGSVDYVGGVSLNMFGEGLNEALMPGGNKKAKQLGDGE